VEEMKIDISCVEYSRNDQRIGIKIPGILNSELAHFLGIHIGDGHLSIQRRGTTVDYYMAYHGHKSDEANWYFQFLAPLFRRQN